MWRTINLEEISSGIIIIAMCAIVLLIGAMKRKSTIIINTILRAVMGSIAIYFINMALIWQGIGIVIGINLATVTTTAILGLPGIIMLYGINIFKLF